MIGVRDKPGYVAAIEVVGNSGHGPRPFEYELDVFTAGNRHDESALLIGHHPGVSELASNLLEAAGDSVSGEGVPGLTSTDTESADSTESGLAAAGTLAPNRGGSAIL